MHDRQRERLTLGFMLALLLVGATLFARGVLGTDGVRRAKERLTDWAKLEQGASAYYEARPTTVEEVEKAVRHAIDKGLHIRVRGRGHSTNGSTLPREGELLLFTEGLNQFGLGERGSMVFGAGYPVFALQDWLNRFGYHLPVMNHGGIAPSIGGFISAGGIGEGSAVYGGFWENVLWVGLVDGQGKYRRIDRDSPLFPWLFGSMGQLGIIVDAALRVVERTDIPQDMIPREGRLPDWWQGQPEFKAAVDNAYKTARVYFVSVFAPPGEEARISQELLDFFKPFESVFEARPLLTLPIRFQTFNPPLVYPQKGSFTGLSLFFSPRNPAESARAMEVEDAFAAFVSERGYRRYIQMELTREPQKMAAYFGPVTWQAFAQVKRELDPDGLFGKGLFP